MSRIPKISDERLHELHARIKPVVRGAATKKGAVRHGGGDLYFIQDVDLRGIAFTWDPVLTQPAEGLKELARIETYHTCGYYGFFKPSIAEVLAQIPSKYLDHCVAYECGVGSLDTSNIVDGGSAHCVTTVLYQRC